MYGALIRELWFKMILQFQDGVVALARSKDQKVSDEFTKSGQLIPEMKALTKYKASYFNSLL